MHALPEYSSALGPPITKAPLNSCRWWSVFKKLCQSSHVTSSPFQQEIVFSTRAVDLALLVFGTVCIAPCVPRWPSWNVQETASCSFKMQNLPLGRLPSSMTQNHGSAIFRKALKILEAGRTANPWIFHSSCSSHQCIIDGYYRTSLCLYRIFA